MPRPPAHFLADTASAAVRDGSITATDHAVIMELIRQYGPQLDRDKALTAAFIATSIGRARSTVAESLKRLRQAGFVKLERHYTHNTNEPKQVPPRYRFPILDRDTKPAELAAMAPVIGVINRKSVNPTAGDRTHGSRSELAPAEPRESNVRDLPRRVEPKTILEYAEKLRSDAAAAKAANPSKGSAATAGGHSETGNEGEAMPAKPSIANLDEPITMAHMKAMRLAIASLLDITDELVSGLSAGATIPAEWAATVVDTLAEHRRAIGFDGARK